MSNASASASDAELPRDLVATPGPDKILWAMGPTDIDKDEFVFPSYGGPLDSAMYVSSVPPHAMVKGMFINSVLEHAREHGVSVPGRGPYRSFKDYPLREALEIQLEVVERLYADRPVREGLRDLGRLAYPTLAHSMIGRVVFGPLGDNLPALFKIAAKGYALSQTVGRAEVLEVHHDSAVVRLTEMYDFPDCYQVGVFEGVLRHHKHRGDVKIRVVPDDPFTLDMWIRWDR